MHHTQLLVIEHTKEREHHVQYVHHVLRIVRTFIFFVITLVFSFFLFIVFCLTVASIHHSVGKVIYLLSLRPVEQDMAIDLLCACIWERMGHDWQQAILKCVERCEVEEEAENTLPDVLLRRFERLSHDLINLDVKLQPTPGIVNELTDLFVYLSTLALFKFHQRVPIGGETILGQGSLHLY